MDGRGTDAKSPRRRLLADVPNESLALYMLSQRSRLRICLF